MVGVIERRCVGLNSLKVAYEDGCYHILLRKTFPKETRRCLELGVSSTQCKASLGVSGVVIVVVFSSEVSGNTCSKVLSGDSEGFGSSTAETDAGWIFSNLGRSSIPTLFCTVRESDFDASACNATSAQEWVPLESDNGI